MRNETSESELIVQEAYEESPVELSSRNPMVLSCGGIYIPNDKRGFLDRPLWEILNVADNSNPVRVVCSSLPRDPLLEIMEKESMN